MLAIIEASRAGLFKFKNNCQNAVSGLIVGIVALPLAMAFAIASGATPAQGLYTSIVAGICVAIFGGSRVQIAGPTGAFIVILASITARYGISGLQIATLLAGLILLLMGILKIGHVIKFIPDPVIVGFTSGIGVIIFVGEWKDFFGLQTHLALDIPFYQKFSALVQALPHLNLTTTALALLSLLLVIITPKFIKKIPGPLIAMIIVTLLQTIFHFKNVATLGSAFGGISRHLPHFQLPELNITQLLSLIGPAFTIALLGAIESLLSATAADGMAGTRHNSNQELIGQGIANMLSPLFGGFAATGAIARTATNIRNGGNSPVSAIVHSIVLILVIVLLAPLASNIPLCLLAAILFVVAYNMSDIPHFIRMIRKAPYYDVIVLLTTFLLTVFTNLVVAVNIGVILAMLLFIRRMHQTVTVQKETENNLNLKDYKIPNDVLVYTIQGPFFFGVAEKIERALQFSNNLPNTVIFRLKEVPFIDVTGLETFEELLHQYHNKGIKIYLCEANEKVCNKISKMGILQWVCGKHIFNSIADVFKSSNAVYLTR